MNIEMNFTDLFVVLFSLGDAELTDYGDEQFQCFNLRISIEVRCD